MTIILADITAEIIAQENFTYENLWRSTGKPYDYKFDVDSEVFRAVLNRVRAIEDVTDLATLACGVDITTSLVVEMITQAKMVHINMNLLHAGAVCAIVVSMIRTLTTPNPSPEELDMMLRQH